MLGDLLFYNYVVDTNSACQGEFTECKVHSAHPKHQESAQETISAAFWEWKNCRYMSYTMSRLFLSCESWSMVTRLALADLTILR